MARFIAACVSGAAGTASLVPCATLKAGDEIVSIASEVVFNTDLLPTFGKFVPTDGFVAWLGTISGAALQAMIIMVERPGT